VRLVWPKKRNTFPQASDDSSDPRIVTIIVATLIILLGYLVLERAVISRARSKIPLVITVTGIRGKSSVARSIGAVLRASGRRVLVKTTGTEAQVVLPDGSVEEITRRGIPSVLEQTRVLRRAARLGVDVLVAEVMSIEKANHRVESSGILRPDIVMMTAIRLDHIESMGSSLEEIAETLACDMVSGSTTYVVEEQAHLIAQGRQKSLVAVGRSTAPYETSAGVRWFPENDRLVVAVAQALGVSDQAVNEGLATATFDRGALGLWEYTWGGKTILLANALAANDPDSTFEILEHMRSLLKGRRLYGLFALRWDRADRTLQWKENLGGARWSSFERVFLVGDVPRSIQRGIRNSSKLSGKQPEKIMEQAMSAMKEGDVLFGFGNTHGIGLELIEYWIKEGKVYGI
jgi:poly-gamma-glutamate synthase PgsB/CapB